MEGGVVTLGNTFGTRSVLRPFPCTSSFPDAAVTNAFGKSGFQDASKDT